MTWHLISQLAHVELLTPRPQESLEFFRDVLGLEESGHQGQSVYLRCWGEHLHHSVKLTESPQPGLGHAAWRTKSAATLEEAVRTLEASGLGEGWTAGDLGHGPAYRFRSPDGHLAEVLWQVERAQIPEDMRSPYLNRPQKAGTRGAAVRRLNHVTLFTSDVRACRELYCDRLGFKYMEGILLDGPEIELFAAISAIPESHDQAWVLDRLGRGRFNHLAFWQDGREDVMRTADVLREHGVRLEAGPGKHSIGEAFFIYVLEPGGNRIEVYSGGYQVLDPEWGPVIWRASQGPASAWAPDLPESLYTYGTPVVDVPQGAAQPVPVTPR